MYKAWKLFMNPDLHNFKFIWTVKPSAGPVIGGGFWTSFYNQNIAPLGFKHVPTTVYPWMVNILKSKQFPIR